MASRTCVSTVINVASVTHRSPFRYPGGKTWLVPYVRQWLRSLVHRPHEFVEPFAGGGIVGLSVLFEGLTQKTVLVELDKDVAAVWKVILSVQGERFASQIAQFPFSDKSVRSALQEKSKGLFEKAFQTILRNRVQRGGIMAPGAGLVKRGENGRGLASRWYPATLEKRILAITAERHRIRFIHGDGLQFIQDNSGRNDMAFFIDPPYTVAGRRLYTHSDIDHERLFELMSSVRGDFLMTYDDAYAVRQLAKRFNLDTARVAMKSTHHAIMKELLVGRDLNWFRGSGSAQLAENSLFEHFQADRHASSQSLY